MGLQSPAPRTGVKVDAPMGPEQPRLGCLAIVATAFALACSEGSPSQPTVSEPAGSSAIGNAGAAGAAGGAAPAGGAAGSSTGGAGAAAGGHENTAGASVGGSSSAGVGGTSGEAGFCRARSGLAFCEDFEGFASGAPTFAPPWTVAINGEGTVGISDEQKHAGARSLRVFGGGFSTFLVYRDAKVLPASSGRFYLRVFMRLSEAMTAGHNTFIVGDLSASPGAGNALRLGEMNQMLMYTVAGDTHGALANENYYTDHLPGAALAAGSWSCLEMSLDSSKPELRVWLDGAEIADLHHADFPVDAYDTLRFGFEKYAGPAGEIFYDDLAIGSEPIGCN